MRASCTTGIAARWTLVVPGTARAALENFRAGEVDFHKLAEEQIASLSQTADEGTRGLCSVVRRGSVSGERSDFLAEAAPGEIVGQVRNAEGYSLIRVLSRTPARLDEATRRTIQKLLFEEWLEQRRQCAKVEWFWGNVTETTALNEPALNQPELVSAELV